ncbi:hypothetical protein PFISCL1PPCAC_20440 [Pristionchus fissidentatus]|uniref:E3 ubiquitin-protein transferase MAEA n=1 Tax=Pristionchus fissidentatus TaxID=1538716 RepID=A0AAV5WFK8_9BILA|nr:hypothetical protein PFISCL1PPCAC_20440 [Pristionchus fissidentatus]
MYVINVCDKYLGNVGISSTLFLSSYLPTPLECILPLRPFSLPRVSAPLSLLKMATGHPQYDELTAVEYSSLRVPYETLNRKFRHMQKNIEKAAFRFSKENEMNMKKKTREAKIRGAEELSRPLSIAISSLEDSIAMATSSIDEEIALLETMMTRIAFLQCGPSLDEEADADTKNLWDVKRADRMVAEQLLRFGYIDTAKKLVKESGIEPLVDIEPYEKACAVIYSLQNHSMALLHEWINEHRSRLKRVTSSLEVNMWMQEAIELVRKDDRKGAIAIMRKHVTPNGNEKKKGGDVDMERVEKKREMDEGRLPLHFEQVNSLIMMGRNTKMEKLKVMLGNGRWTELIDMFREDFASLYQLPDHTSFSVALQVGICAHKTPWCTKDGNKMRTKRRQREAKESQEERQLLIDEGKIKWTPTLDLEEEDRRYKEEKEKKKKDDCPCCDPIAFKIAEGLPYAHVSNSRLFCAHTREVLNEDNQPYQLPSGYVYGQKGLLLLEREPNMYLCPRTDQLFQRHSAQRLYIL